MTQGVHNNMCTRSTVIDVTKNMQLVNSQTLNHITDGNDKVVCTACRNDGVDDDAYIGCLIIV